MTSRERYYVDQLFFQGKTYREVARRQGIDPAVVHRSVQRGLAKLRRQFAKPATRKRLRVTRFRGPVRDAFDPDDGVY
jgi:DNA-directed RNA polymerase specialized sigma24 family protein